MSLFKRHRVFSSAGEVDVINIGTVPDDAAGLTGVHYTETKNIVTVLTLDEVPLGDTGGAALGLGLLVYTFPAGAHVHSVTYADLQITSSASGESSEAEVGIGSEPASGAISVLSGTATFEDYVTGQAYAFDTAVPPTLEVTLPATAGLMTGISLNKTADTKDVCLNVASTWGESGTITASGTIVLVWTKLK